MISINGIENTYVIDLNESIDGVYSLSVDSLPWNIDYISNNEMIRAFQYSGHFLKIIVDLVGLKEDGLIILKNLKKEKISIVLKPNLTESREREYTFKLCKISIDGKSITFNVISKENGKNVPWIVLHNGTPIGYLINKTKTKVTFTLSMILGTEVISHISLKQDESDKIIEIQLKHVNSNSVELYSTKEAD